MPFVKGQKLSQVLDNNDYPHEQKMNLLKQVGETLDKLQKIRRETLLYLTDLHEENIIVDDNNKVHFIDLDSSYITNMDPFPSKYLYENKLINEHPLKYKSNVFGITHSSLDSEMLCYHMMILNYLTGKDVNKMEMEAFIAELYALYQNGVEKDLIESSLKLYSDEENINPYKTLNCLKYYPPRKGREK